VYVASVHAYLAGVCILVLYVVSVHVYLVNVYTSDRSCKCACVFSQCTL